MRHLYPLLSVLFILPLLAAAQEAASSRSCRILFLTPAADTPKTLYLYDGIESLEVDLPRMNLSQAYTLRSGPLRLKLIEYPASDTHPVPPNAPYAEVAAEQNDIYLILESDPASTVTPVQMTIVDAGQNRYGKGEMLWLNHTNKEIEGYIGFKELRIQPGGDVIIADPAMGKTSYPVELFYKPANKNKAYPLCETVWRHDPRSRNLIIIIDDEKRNVPRILSFSDFRR